MESVKKWFSNIDLKVFNKVVKSNSFVIFSLILFFPIGLILLWKSKNFRKKVKISITIVGTIGTLSYLFFILSTFTTTEALLESNNAYSELYFKYQTIEKEKNTLSKEYIEYKNKMKPYESLSKSDAQKKENDAKRAKEVN